MVLINITNLVGPSSKGYLLLSSPHSLDLPPKKESIYNVSKLGRTRGDKWSGEVDYQEPLAGCKQSRL